MVYQVVLYIYINLKIYYSYNSTQGRLSWFPFCYFFLDVYFFSVCKEAYQHDVHMHKTLLISNTLHFFKLNMYLLVKLHVEGVSAKRTV